MEKVVNPKQLLKRAFIGTRVLLAEQKRLKREAERQGKSLSQLVRERIRAA